MPKLSDNPNLLNELDALARYIQRVRKEIAAIDRPADETHGFNTMGEQMDAVVKATEQATDTIMAAMENNETVIDQLRARLQEPAHILLLDQLTANANTVFEACSFQHITGQRVGKVAKSITYVEQRVDKLIELLGTDETHDVEVEVPDGWERDGDEALLNGPQLDGQGLKQDDIDKLFD